MGLYEDSPETYQKVKRHIDQMSKNMDRLLAGEKPECSWGCTWLDKIRLGAIEVSWIVMNTGTNEPDAYYGSNAYWKGKVNRAMSDLDEALKKLSALEDRMNLEELDEILKEMSVLGVDHRGFDSTLAKLSGLSERIDLGEFEDLVCEFADVHEHLEEAIMEVENTDGDDLCDEGFED